MNIEKRRLGNTGLEVTRIGFGALEIGRNWGVGDAAATQRPDAEDAAHMLNGVLQLGVNLIDTASAYHRSEERIGETLATRRDEYILATKCGEYSVEPNTFYDFSYEGIARSIDESLRKLRTDSVDILQIHFGPNPQQVLDDGETVRAMKDAQAAGKAKFLGASPGNDVLENCIDSGDFDVLQIGYSLLDRGADELISRAADKGIGVLIRSGLAGGWLTPRVLAMPENERPENVRALLNVVDGDADKLQELALQFLRAHDGISSVLIGSKNLENFRRNFELFQAPPDDELLQRALNVL